MAVQKLPDGRWTVYYNDPLTKKRKKECFGLGLEAEAKAHARNKQLNFRRDRPPREQYGPTFQEISDLYFHHKGFDKKPRQTLSYRLDCAILPAIGHRPVMMLTHDHL